MVKLVFEYKNVSHPCYFSVLKLKGNSLKDRRFRKLIENARTQPDQIMKYIKQHCPKGAPVVEDISQCKDAEQIKV